MHFWPTWPSGKYVVIIFAHGVRPSVRKTKSRFSANIEFGQSNVTWGPAPGGSS